MTGAVVGAVPVLVGMTDVVWVAVVVVLWVIVGFSLFVVVGAIIVVGVGLGGEWGGDGGSGCQVVVGVIVVDIVVFVGLSYTPCPCFLLG